MTKHLRLALPLLALAACGSPVSGTCKRLDECNALAAGTSVDQCEENLDKTLDNMTESVRSDCESDLHDALKNESCEAFLVDFATSCRTGGGGDTGF